MSNFARNLNTIRNGKSIKELKILDNSIIDYKSKETAIVIGGGPTVKRKNQLKLIKKSRYSGTIVCTDRMLIPFLKEGFFPRKKTKIFVVTVDPAEVIAKFFDDKILNKFKQNISIVLSTCCSPEVVKKCKKNNLDVFWFHPLIDDYRKNVSITKTMNMMVKNKKNPKGLPGLQTGGNSGAAAWIFSWSILGKSPIGLIGLNFGYDTDSPVEETPHYKSLLKANDFDEIKTRGNFKKIHNKDFNCDTFVDPIFQYYREALKDLVVRTPKWVKTINATEGGSLFGKNIVGMKLSDFLTKYKK